MSRETAKRAREDDEVGDEESELLKSKRTKLEDEDAEEEEEQEDEKNEDEGELKVVPRERLLRTCWVPEVVGSSGTEPSTGNLSSDP
jgi:hypothetical protein